MQDPQIVLPGMSTKLQRIAAKAQLEPDCQFRSLAHQNTVDALRQAFGLLRKGSASGVDGVTYEQYASDLESNLRALHRRLKDDSYRAPPVRRVQIPKGRGKTRPIGIPTLEDKIVQRAFKTLLDAIYEQDFLDCSYGFRPGRSCHDALESLRNQCFSHRVRWILDADIKGFFDTLNHTHLREFLRRRVVDPRILHMINRWLKAGVMEGGNISYPVEGTPQGGVISPLLANIYLHYVLDTWFEQQVCPRLEGRAFLVRYADDFVIGFESKVDAERVLAVLVKRFAKYGLELHPDKTRLVAFGRPPKDKNSSGVGPGKPETFDFLGFTHYWGRSRNGNTVIKKKTAKQRLARSIRQLYEWCRLHRHDPIKEQWKTLCSKLIGHYGYYGVTSNYRSTNKVLRATQRSWHKWLGRRNQRGMTWERFKRLLKTYPLPPPRALRSSYRPATGIAKR